MHTSVQEPPLETASSGDDGNSNERSDTQSGTVDPSPSTSLTERELPIPITPLGTELTPYEMDKKMGRRDDAGRWNLKELKPKHRRILGAHLEGMANKEIALAFNVNEQYVSNLLRDPLAQQTLTVFREGMAEELLGLMPLAIRVLRESLQSRDSDTRLKAIDKFDKLVKLAHPETREGGGTTINVSGDDARLVFMDKIQGMEKRFGSLIDARTEPEGEVE